jgi:hypothetical protein
MTLSVANTLYQHQEIQITALTQNQWTLKDGIVPQQLKKDGAGLKNSVPLQVHSEREVPISKKGTMRMNSQSQLGKGMKSKHQL